MRIFKHPEVFGAAAFSVLLSFFALYAASAQTVAGFSVTLTPESPGPFAEVKARAVSFSLDLDRSTIAWVLNGKTALSGVGKKEFSFTTGAIGAPTRLTVSVSGAAGRFDQTITITPGGVDLLWQTDGYVPPFYKGKSLPTPGAAIKVVAMPNLGSGAPKSSSLVYDWSRNYQAAGGASGYGQNVYSFKNSYLDPEENIKVTVSSLNGAVGAEGKLNIVLGAPLVLFYENNPLQGLRLERALPASFPLSNNEVRVTAEPFFFSAFDRQDGNLRYEWQLDGRTISGAPDDRSSLVLRSGGGSGTAQISLAISHLKKIMQTAGNSFSVTFGQ